MDPKARKAGPTPLLVRAPLLLGGGSENIPPGMLEVTLSQMGEGRTSLDIAVEQVSEAAQLHGTGVMITRIAKDRYIVRAHPAVPCGFVRQQLEEPNT